MPGPWSTRMTRCSPASRAREGSVVHFGLDDASVARERLQHAADSKYCVDCGSPFVYDAAYVGHLGEYRCPSCGTARPALDVAARSIDARWSRAHLLRSRHERGTRRVELELPGLYNVYNAVAAASLALVLGAGLDDVVEGLGRFRPAFGRFERIRAGGKVILMLLVKNPAGANEVVRTLTAGGAPPVAVVALNDDVADGRDVSWIWDVDFEPLIPALDRLVASGEPCGGAGPPLQVRRLRRGEDRGRARARAGARSWPRTDARRCGGRRAADVHRDAGATRCRGAPGARPAVLGHGWRVRQPGARVN